MSHYCAFILHALSQLEEERPFNLWHRFGLITLDIVWKLDL